MTTHRAKAFLSNTAPLLLAAVLSACGSSNNEKDFTQSGTEQSAQGNNPQGMSQHFTPVAVGSIPSDNNPTDGQTQPSLQGPWGGDHVSLNVNAQGMKVQFDCGQGKSNETISLGNTHRFSTIGVLTTNRGNGDLQTLLASYEVTFAAQTMSLRVAYEINGESHTEDYLLERNREPVFFNCN